MGEEPQIEEITAANSKAFATLREMTDRLKLVVEHEVLINEDVQKRIEVHSSLQSR